MRRIAPLLRRHAARAAPQASPLVKGVPCGRQHSGAVSTRWSSSGAAEDSDDAFKPKRASVPPGKDEIQSLIDQQVKENKLMIYMKGTPAAPQCGFSMNVVRILHDQGASFSSVNVLDYPEIREGIKSYSSWPTIPQVYLDGEFLGGSDIVTQLHQNGELKTMLEEKGLI